jgi:hypothetical protein
MVALAAAMAAFAMPAQAITGNWQPDFEHEYVGLVVFYFEDTGEFSHRCSGSLISPSVFLTAGHCVDESEGALDARIYFHQAVGANYDPVTQLDPTTGYPEYCIRRDPLCVEAADVYNYGYPAGFPDTGDVGLVILDKPMSTDVIDSYGSLAEPGYLDALETSRGTQDVTFTVSGYGVTDNHPNFPLESYRSRLMATSTLRNLTSAWNDGFNIQTGGEGNDKGGTCGGDSGGPVFHGEEDAIVAVTSFGKLEHCVGSDFAYRVDQQAVLDWIETVLTTEENLSSDWAFIESRLVSYPG